MSDEYVIPESPGGPPMSVLPTDRLVEIVAVFHVLENALIEIATDFDICCRVCWRGVEDGCLPTCAGLLARRALGVA